MKIRKAIIPVAGLGTRFLPATKSIPKEMFPIVDKPIIQYIVEEAVQSGIEEILFITNPYKESIVSYFDRSFELEHRLQQSGKIELLDRIQSLSCLAKFYYLRQGEPMGTGHAVLLAKEFVGNEPFAILYGDDIIDSSVPCLKQMIDVFEQHDCNVLCVEELEEDMISGKGIIEYEDIEIGKIKSIVEKPNLEEAPSNHGSLGRYILKPEIFDELEKIDFVNGELLLTDAILRLMQTQSFYACKFDGQYYDVGSKFGFIKANVEFALKDESLHGIVLDYLSQKNKSSF